MVVHSYEYISKFAAGQVGQLIQHSQGRSQTHKEKGSNSQPVVELTQNFFFIFQRAKVEGFDLETGLLVRGFT